CPVSVLRRRWPGVRWRFAFPHAPPPPEGLGRQSNFVVIDDLVRRAQALRRAALHIPLEVLRAVLAGKVALARDRIGLADLLVAGELRVLPDLPVGVRAQQEWVAQWHVEGRASIPLPGDAWERGLDLAQEYLGELGHLRAIRWIASERSQRHTPARVVDEESGRPILRARDIPGVLVARVRVSATVADPPRPWRVPVPGVELQV